MALFSFTLQLSPRCVWCTHVAVQVQCRGTGCITPLLPWPQVDGLQSETSGRWKFSSTKIVWFSQRKKSWYLFFFKTKRNPFSLSEKSTMRLCQNTWMFRAAYQCFHQSSRLRDSLRGWSRSRGLKYLWMLNGENVCWFSTNLLLPSIKSQILVQLLWTGSLSD